MVPSTTSCIQGASLREVVVVLLTASYIESESVKGTSPRKAVFLSTNVYMLPRMQTPTMIVASMKFMYPGSDSDVGPRPRAVPRERSEVSGDDADVMYYSWAALLHPPAPAA